MKGRGKQRGVQAPGGGRTARRHRGARRARWRRSRRTAGSTTRTIPPRRPPSFDEDVRARGQRHPGSRREQSSDRDKFGYHVIRLDERLPEKRIPLEERRRMLSDEIVARRAAVEQQRVLGELAKSTPIRDRSHGGRPDRRSFESRNERPQRRGLVERDQHASRFSAILLRLCEATFALAAALVDSGGETVDYAGKHRSVPGQDRRRGMADRACASCMNRA